MECPRCPSCGNIDFSGQAKREEDSQSLTTTRAFMGQVKRKRATTRDPILQPQDSAGVPSELSEPPCYCGCEPVLQRLRQEGKREEVLRKRVDRRKQFQKGFLLRVFVLLGCLSALLCMLWFRASISKRGLENQLVSPLQQS